MIKPMPADNEMPQNVAVVGRVVNETYSVS